MPESARVEVDTGVEPWEEGCQASQPCRFGAAALKPCTHGEARSVADVLGNRAALAGHRVSVRGLLGVGDMAMSVIGCPGGPPYQCCNGARRPVVLAEDAVAGHAAEERLPLRGLSCSGDESAQCCNAPAYGQAVVATGLFEAARARPPGGSGWVLDDVLLCAPP